MNAESVSEGTTLWEPSEEFLAQTNIKKYMDWLKENKGLDFDGYGHLWEWSVTDIEDFWASIWEYFEVKASKPYTQVLSERKMPGARWFLDSELNLAERVFSQMSSDRPAIIFKRENEPLVEVSWDDFYKSVSSLAAALRNMGVQPGDRIVAYMPNIPEAAIAFQACASIGAIWSSCSPDFGSRSVVDRFKQIEPKVLIATDGYRYGGRGFDRRSVVSELQESLKTLEKTVLIPYLDKDVTSEGLKDVLMWEDIQKEDGGTLVFEQVPFSHPLWVVYSSGTTGLPKALVQSQGGILIEQLKFLGLHVDLKPDDRFFWFSTTGWIMWNIVMSGLLHGSTVLLYDGNPGYPDLDVLWKFAEESRMTVFGTGAAFLVGCMRAGMEPGKDHDLSNLNSIGSTGSPLPPEGFQWVYEHVKKDLWLGSTSGGTDVATGFLGGSPILPVRAGELQCRCLGVKAEAFDESGNPLVDEVGELVITEPMPSMPLYLWNDPEDRRYMESFFDMYPGVWRHGDWVKFTPEGSGIIYGRSDSTINRLGIRMGSSEIYSAVEDLPEVLDSLVLGYEPPGGGYYMPLFVALEEGLELDEALKKKINTKLRNTLSPRHVPDAIFSVPDVPKTLNNKKLEVPVKKILMGMEAEKAVNVDSMANPEVIEHFVELAQRIGPKSG
ncbi:MAG: acetoacetate--CoA ligase [Desulfatiglandaceae bacterium]